jgi:hypothetical protein
MSVGSSHRGGTCCDPDQGRLWVALIPRRRGSSFRFLVPPDLPSFSSPRKRRLRGRFWNGATRRSASWPDHEFVPSSRALRRASRCQFSAAQGFGVEYGEEQPRRVLWSGMEAGVAGLDGRPLPRLPAFPLAGTRTGQPAGGFRRRGRWCPWASAGWRPRRCHRRVAAGPGCSPGQGPPEHSCGHDRKFMPAVGWTNRDAGQVRKAPFVVTCTTRACLESHDSQSRIEARTTSPR